MKYVWLFMGCVVLAHDKPGWCAIVATLAFSAFDLLNKHEFTALKEHRRKNEKS